MAIKEIITTGRKYRRCIDNTPGNKKWERFSFWTASSDVEFPDGSTLQQKLGTFKGVTTNENQVAGYGTDITIFKALKTSVTNSVASLTNLINSISNRLGGMRFYEDSTGKYVVGADSVPKKLGSLKPSEWTVIAEEEYRLGREDSPAAIVQVEKQYDIKTFSPGYQNLTSSDFYVEVTSVKTAAEIPHGGFDNISYGHGIKNYDPATGILTVYADTWQLSNINTNKVTFLRQTLKIYLCG